MASFTLKPLQLQTYLQLSSFSHSKHSCTLNTFQFYLPSYSDSTKHTLIVQATARVATHFETTTYISEERSTNNVNGADFDTSKSDGRKSLERNRQWHMERKPILKDKYKKLENRRRKEVDSEVEKRSKKLKADVDALRVGLDMCSKRGDVVGAIKLYDLARKEGCKIGQYHYAVLLYLCSSAATGMVHPAKSGSSRRILSSGDLGSAVEFGGKNSEKIELNIDDNDDFRAAAETVDSLVESMKKSWNNSTKKGCGIEVSEGLKVVAIRKGFEIYNEMRLERVAMNEATVTSVSRMAMALGDGDMAFRIVKEMKEYGVNPRLRSYGPALAVFCSNGDVESAFRVEKHMLENGAYPEEPELEALLLVSVEAGKSERVYYVLHKLRTSVRQVLPSTADLIEKWFRSTVASRVGKRKWDKELIGRAMGDGGGGWHGKGWLGRGKWTIIRTGVGSDGICKCCGEKLVTVDLDPVETEEFAKSVAAIAAERERNSSFQKFQKWLEYYGPFEAVVDAANVGLYSQRKFKPSKVNAIVNGIRQMLPSRKCPLIVLHNRRITGEKMDEPFNRVLIDKWRKADALYATPTGSNDDWYWLYAAIKFKSLIVTNDEMRDHLFQLLGNDFFPKWKERHQVHFSFTETGPMFRMPPPCSVVIQESEEGHWHIPIASEVENEDERIWLCCSRRNSSFTNQDSSHVKKEAHPSRQKKREARKQVETIFVRERNQHESSTSTSTILPQLEDAEKYGACVIDFQI